jgi:hypothetical protein
MRTPNVHTVSAMACIALLLGCRGTAVDFQPTFESISSGTTRTEMLHIAGEPMSSEKWEFAGVGFERLLYADARASYVVVIASVPFMEPRVVGKRQAALLSSKCN